MRSTWNAITGEPGAGKSFWAVSQIPKLEGIIYTNLPVTEHLPVGRDGKNWLVPVTNEDVLEWCRGNVDIAGPGYLILDEGHQAFPPGQEASDRRAITTWAALMRHRGIQIWLITQDLSFIMPNIKKLLGYERRILTGSNERDSIFRVSKHDWNLLKSKLSGRWEPVCLVEEWANPGRSAVLVGSKWQEINADVFTWYNSFNNESGTGNRPLLEWERRSFVGLLGLVLLRNFPYYIRSLAAAFLCVMVVLGFGPWLLPLYIGLFQSFVAQTPVAAAASLEQQIEQYQPMERGESYHAIEIFAPSPVRINRVGVMLLVGGRLYDAARLYSSTAGNPGYGAFRAAGVGARPAGNDRLLGMSAR